MSNKKFRSKLFQAQPNQLLLDERVSKIILPEIAAEEKLEELDSVFLPEQEEQQNEESLQIFVGAPETEIDPSSTWEIEEESSYDAFSDFDSEEEPTTVIPLEIPSKLQEYHEDSTIPLSVPLESIREVYDSSSKESLVTVDIDEWSEIDWDDVTLSDILGEEDQEDEDNYGESLGLWLEDSSVESQELDSVQEAEELDSSGFSFESLFSTDGLDPFDSELSYEQSKEEEKLADEASVDSIEIEDDLPVFVAETEWWQHPILVFVAVFLGTMSVFMLLIHFLRAA